MESSDDVIIVGLSNLRVTQQSTSMVSVAILILAGVRDTTIEDGAFILQNISSVAILNLSGTAIRSLVVFKTNFYDIKELDLSNTRITQKEANYIGAITSLYDLQIGSNRNINNILFLIKLKKLETLGISFTSVKHVSVLLNLPNMQFLDISGNKLAEGTPDIINRLYNLRELDASFSSLDITQLGKEVFARLFRVTYSIKKNECLMYYPETQRKDMTSKIGHNINIGTSVPAQVITIEIKKKPPTHPNYGKGSHMAFRVMEMPEEDFGKPLTLENEGIYTFLIHQHRHPEARSKEHPFYVDWIEGGGPDNNKKDKIAPSGATIGVVNGQLLFQPDIRDGRTLYAECAHHRYMGFPIRITEPGEFVEDNICSLCGVEAIDVSQMYGCADCEDAWYCSVECANTDHDEHKKECVE